MIRTQDAHDIFAFVNLLSNGFVPFLQRFLLFFEYFSWSVSKYIYDVPYFMEILPGQKTQDKSSELRSSNFQRRAQKIRSNERYLEYSWPCVWLSAKSDDKPIIPGR